MENIKLKNEQGMFAEMLDEILCEEFGRSKYESNARMLFSNLDKNEIKYLVLLIKFLAKNFRTPEMLIDFLGKVEKTQTKLMEKQDAHEEVLNTLMSNVEYIIHG